MRCKFKLGKGDTRVTKFKIENEVNVWIFNEILPLEASNIDAVIENDLRKWPIIFGGLSSLKEIPPQTSYIFWTNFPLSECGQLRVVLSSLFIPCLCRVLSNLLIQVH